MIKKSILNIKKHMDNRIGVCYNRNARKFRSIICGMKVKVVNDGFCQKIQIDEKLYSPFAFKSFRPSYKNISDFYSAGVKLFCVLSTGLMSATKGVPYSHFGESWIDDYTYDFTSIDKQMDLFIKAAPEAYFDVMLVVDMREWWLKKYPEYPNSYWNMSQVCTDSKWRNAAAAYLKNAVEHIEEKYGDRVFAYHIMGGTTTEWLSENDYENPSDIKSEAFKKYTKNENAVIPSLNERELPTERVFLDPVEDSNLIEYRKFHSEIIADTILYFAKTVKETVQYKKLVGVYYGYLFELGGPRLWNTGHLACDKIFNSEYIDMISAPSSYSWFRRKEGVVGYMLPVDTLTLNNKVFFQEFDHRTFLPSLQFESEKTFPGSTDGAKNRQETINMIRREYLSVQSKGLALWWFDMFEGWYYDEELMREINKCVELGERFSQSKSISEIAVIADNESLYYVNKNAHINSELLLWQRAELSKSGAPYDMYLASSLDKINFEQYKLVIFLNQFKYNERYEKIINDKIKKDGKTVLWMYAPNYISDVLGVKGVCEATGMRIGKLSNTETIVNVNDKRFGFSFPKDTMFYVNVEGDDYFTSNEKDVEILGRYQINFSPAVVRKNFEKYKSIFCAVGYMTADVLREIAGAAGVHIYSYDSDNIVYVNSEMIGVYHRTGKDAEIIVKEDGEYTDLYSGETFVSENKKLTLRYDERTANKCLIKQCKK